MKFKKDQRVIYKSISGHTETATIIAVKDDFPNQHIKTANADGNFDYIISIQKSGITEQKFCM